MGICFWNMVVGLNKIYPSRLFLSTESKFLLASFDGLPFKRDAKYSVSLLFTLWRVNQVFEMFFSKILRTSRPRILPWILEFSRLMHVPLERVRFSKYFSSSVLDFKIKPWGRTFFMSLMRPIDLTSLCGLKFIVGDINLWKGGVIASSGASMHQGNVITETSSLERIKSFKLWSSLSGIKYSSRSKISKWV